MAAAEYPNLGFDPAPGAPGAVEDLERKVKSTVDSMNEAGKLMDRLRNSHDAVWQGAAGDAFRQHFDGKLVTELDHAHQSLHKAVTVVQRWHGDLTHFRETAAHLEEEAARAKQEQARADQAAQQAKANPDLGLANQSFPDDASLKQAQRKLDSAESTARDATSKASAAADKVQDVIRRAKDLQQRHEDTAKQAAKALKDATVNLAPEQGLLDKIGDMFSSAVNSAEDWVKAHLKDIHSVLATTSAVAGLLALVTPPPVDVIALGVAAASSAGALATDAADPKFRNGIGQLLHGQLNKDSLGAAMTGVSDSAGLIPGATFAGKAGLGAIKGTNSGVVTASGATGIAGIAENTAHDPGLMVKGLNGATGGVIGRTATFGDKLLTKAIPAVKAGDRAIEPAERFAMLWKARGVGSAVQHDVKQANS